MKTKSMAAGLIGGLCMGEQSTITYHMVLSLQTGCLAQLAQGGLTIPITVSDQEDRLTPTPEVALVSLTAGDKSLLDFAFSFVHFPHMCSEIIWFVRPRKESVF